MRLRYNLKEDFLFYLLVAAYAWLVLSMTYRLWFGGGVNIFATYSAAGDDAARMLVDANYVYWSKTGFLFLSILLFALRLDYRFVVGAGIAFWSGSLLLMFGVKPVLALALLLGLSLVGVQIYRGRVWES